jgi:formylglycine-generating enzyme required for sulfatase activity
MGSPRDEAGRDADEDPAPVILPRFAISRFPVTLGQYAAFADETGRGAPGGCITSRIAAGRWTANPSATWRRPAFTAGDRDPVVCVSWADAQAFAAWMKTKTGQTYRLVSESEYEYAARAGATTAYFWGPDAGDACAHANGADAAARRAFPISRALTCDDGFARLSPVGSFNPNAWGLYDIAGDVWSWTADCYAASYQANPKNGLPLDLDMCGDRVVRGGSWLYDPVYLRSAARGYNIPDFRNYQVGFRVGRSLGPLDAGPP